MRRRQRKLVGTVATIVFVIGYALVAMMLAQLRLHEGRAGRLAMALLRHRRHGVDPAT